MSVFKVRNMTQVSKRLGENAIENSYAGMPIRVEDELDWDACHFAT